MTPERGEGRGGINRANRSPRDRAVDHGAVGETGHGPFGSVARLARDLGVSVDPRHRPADLAEASRGIGTAVPEMEQLQGALR